MDRKLLVRPGTWFADFDENGNCTTVQYADSFRKLIGYEADEFIDDNSNEWLDAIHPDDKERAVRALNDCVSENSSEADYDIEYRMMTKWGYHWFHDYAHCVRREDGTGTHCDGVIFDIDDAVKQRKSLADHRVLLDYFVDQYWSACFIDLANDTLEILRANNANTNAYIMNGSREDMARFIDARFHPDDTALMHRITDKSFIRKELKDKPSVSYTAREIIDGQERTMRILIVRGTDEDHVAVGFMDITDEVLEQQKRLLGAVPLSNDVLHKANIGLWAFELDEGLPPRMYADEAMLGLLGLEHQLPPEEIYHAWYDHIDEGSYALVSDAVAKMTSGEHAEVQYPWHYPDGRTIIVRCGGVRNPQYEKGIRIEGTHQNVTRMLHFDEEQQRLNEKLINRMADADGLFLIDCSRDTRKTIHNVNAQNHVYRDEDAYSGSMARYITDLVAEADRDMMRRVTDPAYMLARCTEEQEYKVEYRSIFGGVPHFYEMRVIRFSDTEVLQSFRENDIGILSRFVFNSIESEYLALFGIDLDANLARILKTSPWYEIGHVGDSLPYSETIREIALSLDGDTRAFYERIADIDYLKQRFAHDGKTSYAYKSTVIEDGQWINISLSVLSRKDDGTPALLGLGFSRLDADATEKEELRDRLRESLAFTDYFLGTYVSAYYVSLTTLSCQVYKRTERLAEEYPIVTNFLDSLDLYIQRDVHPDDRAKLTEITRPEYLRKTLAVQPEVTYVLRDISDGAEKTYRFQAIRGADEEHVAFGFVDITDEINAQQKSLRAAEESRRLIESIVNAYSAAYIVNMADDSAKLLRLDEDIYNKEQLTGIKDFRGIRDAFARLIRPSDSERLLKEFEYPTIREKLGQTNSYSVEYTAVIDGDTKWFEMNVTKLSEDEFAIGFADKDLEITKRRLEEKRYDEYFALFVVDIDTGQIKVVKNEGPYQVCPVGQSTGYTPYILGIAEKFDGEPREFFTEVSDLAYVRRELASDDKRTYAYKSPEFAGDRWVDVTTYCILRHDDGTPAMFTLGFSIVDALAAAREELRKRLEDALEKAQIEAQRNDVVISIVNAGRFIYEINAQDEVTAAIYGDISRGRIGEKYLDKMDWIELVHPEDKDRVYSSFMACVRDHSGGTPYDVTFRMMGVNGKYRWVRSGGNVIRHADSSGEFYGISFDITDQMEEQERQQQRLQEALTAAEAASKAKTEFLFNMSHDVRTPMNAILGFTNMAEKHINEKEKVLDCLEKTKQSGSLLLSLINGVLDMSRIEHGSAELDEKAGDIYLSFASIESTLREEAAKKEIDLSFEFGEVTDRYIYSDFTRCLRIFTNLITNSIKYTKEGGWIKVRCEQASPKQDGRARYRYTVEDNGIGISEEFQKRMFESFTREKNSTTSGVQGTGLGLSVCKTFVEYLGGTIECSSRVGEGTTFTVLLPFRVQEGEYYTDVLTGELVKASSRPAETAMKEIDFTGLKVLLVEDNELNREIAAELLEDEGFVVDEVEDGSVAVERLKANGPDCYDFILMDIQMPIMNGYDATRAIREMYPDAHIPIIALSANAFAEDKAASLAAGMDDHVAKPINIRELFGALAKFIDA